MLDNSPEQLARNTYASETILGDLQDPKAFKGSYDLIVCWDVLEHLEKPRAAVENMIASLNDRGLLLIACPNLYSIKGLLPASRRIGSTSGFTATYVATSWPEAPGARPFRHICAAR